MESSNLLIIFVCLLFSAFFSGMEIAFISSNKLKIELDKKLGYLPAKIYSRFVKNQSKFISTLLVGNNIALVIYGIFMAKVLEPVILDFTTSKIWILTTQTVISTILVVVTAEFLPKAFFRLNAYRLLSAFSVPVLFFYFLLYPIMIVTMAISKLVLNLFFKIKISKVEPQFGRVDLDQYLKEATAEVEEEGDIEHEVQIFQNALDFSHVKTRECMVPRTEMIAVDIDTPVEEVRKKFVETGLSKIPVFRDSIDNIIGFVHSFELFKKPEKIKNILLPVSIVPETMPASEVLELFIKKKRSIAIVVDEFGGTSGMLTIEDVVEEIFGEIEDEHDKEVLIERRISESEFVFSARHEIDYLNENYKLSLPKSEDYETLAGLIISYFEDIPEVNKRVEINGYVIQVKKVSENRIELVHLSVKEGK